MRAIFFAYVANFLWQNLSIFFQIVNVDPNFIKQRVVALNNVHFVGFLNWSKYLVKQKLVVKHRWGNMAFVLLVWSSLTAVDCTLHLHKSSFFKNLFVWHTYWRIASSLSKNSTLQISKQIISQFYVHCKCLVRDALKWMRFIGWESMIVLYNKKYQRATLAFHFF